MTCISCQERREIIARIAAQIGTVVFGRKRVLAAPEKPDEILQAAGIKEGKTAPKMLE